MSVVTDLYRSGDSWIHRADPRLKLLFGLSALVLLLIYQHPLFLALALAGLIGLHLVTGSRGAGLGLVLRALLPISALTFALRALFYPAGEALITWGPLALSHEGLATGLALALRILDMGLAVMLILYTTSPPALLQAMMRLGMPYPWALTLALALRLIPSFERQYHLIVEAQRARGLDLESARGLGRARRLMPAFIAMVISSFRATDQLTTALQARALGLPGVKPTSLHPLHLQALDWLLLILILTLTSGLLWLNLGLGIGGHPLFLGL
jgi:energy-coupling factor transport system permease protein